MTQLQIELKSQPQGLWEEQRRRTLLFSPSHTAPYLPSFSLSFSLSPPLRASASTSVTPHLPLCRHICPSLTPAFIDLHLLPVHPHPAFSHFSAHSSDSFSSLLHHCTFCRIFSHHFILSANVSQWVLALQETQNPNLSISVSLPHKQTHKGTHLFLCLHTLVFYHCKAFPFSGNLGREHQHVACVFSLVLRLHNTDLI